MDYYEILEIERSATFDEIRASYRELVKKNHPDHGGSPEKFRLIQKAYEVLSDPKKRAEYDSSNELNPVISFLTRLFLATLDSFDPEKTDLFRQMERNILLKIQEMGNQKQSIKKRIKKLNKAFRCIKKDSSGLFRGVLQTQIQILEESLAALHKAEEVILEAHKKIRDCEYDIAPETLMIEKKTPTPL